MDLKQSASNIVAWAKSHPWLAAAIIGGVVLLAYWASKNVGSGSSGGLEIGPGEDESPLDAGGGSAGGGLADVISQLGQSASSPSPSPITSSPSMTPGSMWEDIAEIPTLSDSFGLPAGIDSPVYTGDAGALARTGLTVPNTSILPGGRVASNAILESGTSGVRPAQPLKKPRRKTPAGGDGNRTPAMLVGKGRHFTGYHLGIYYVNGYPVSTPTSINGVPSVVMPGGRVASTQILGLVPGTTGAHETGSVRRPRRGR